MTDSQLYQVDSTGHVKLIDGALATPSLSFLSDTNTGLYNVSADTLGIVTGGAQAARFTSTSLTLSAANSGIFVNGGGGTVGFIDFYPPASGQYRVGLSGSAIAITALATTIISAGGTVVISPPSSPSWTFNSSSLTSTTGLLAPAVGTVGAPSHSFNGDADTGMYDITANTLGFATNGTEALRIDASQNIGIGGAPVTNGLLTLTSTTKAFVPPRMTLSQRNLISSPSAGMQIFNTTGSTMDYYDGSAWQSFSAGGAPTFPLLGSDGSASAPAYSFTADTNTGMYRIGSDDLGFSTGGSLVLELNPSQQILSPNTAGAGTPAFTFTGDTNTGIYSSGADDLGISAGGSLHAHFSPTQIGFLINSNAQTAALQSTGWIVTGCPIVATTTSNQLALSGPTRQVFINAPQPATASRTMTIQDVSADANFVLSEGSQTINGTKTFGNQILVADGSRNSPEIRWTSDNSGWYRAGTSDFRFAVDVSGVGKDHLKITPSGVYMFDLNNNVLWQFETDARFFGTLSPVNNGASNPGINWFVNGDGGADCGIYRISNASFGFATGGTGRVLVEAGGFRPVSDNAVYCGTASQRFNDIYGVTLHSGDIELDNHWRITEGDKVGHPEEGVMFLSPTGKKYKIAMTEVE